MRASPVEVIVTLPARNLTEVREQLPPAVAAGASAAEIRFDRWNDEEWKNLPDLFPSPLPLIATYRSVEEGGGGASDTKERERRLHALEALPFRYIDLERARDFASIERLLAREGPPRPIISTHAGFGWTLSDIEEGLRAPSASGSLVKVVVPATVSRLYSTLRPLLPFTSDEQPRTLLTTWGSGPVLRALSQRLGIAAVYTAPPSTGARGPVTTAVEPAQIPVDAIVPFLRTAGVGRLFALLGHPVAHSLSPRVHVGWYARQNRHALFVPIDIDPSEGFRQCIDDLAQDGFVGFNVTHPWKGEALNCASSASPHAKQAGCANTLTREPNGWAAENFDVSALVRRGEELRTSGVWEGDDLLVLGGGGAARAALVAAKVLGVRARVQTRDPTQAKSLAHDLGTEVAPADGSPASLIIHATTAGMAANPAPLQMDWTGHLRKGSYVLDMVYHPESPDVQRAAERGGARYEDGSRLLVYQAAECHRCWWGEPPGSALESWALTEVLCVA